MSIVPEIIETKDKLEKELKVLEKQIFELETSYLQETLNNGNIIKGWDGYLLSKTSKSQPFPLKKPKINQSDMLFSMSSLTSPAIKSLQEEAFNPKFESINKNLLIPSSYRSKRNKKKKNYAQIEGSSYKNSLTKENEKPLLMEEQSLKDEEIYEYDPIDHSDSLLLDLQNKDRSPKKKKNNKKYKQKYRKSKISKF